MGNSLTQDGNSVSGLNSGVDRRECPQPRFGDAVEEPLESVEGAGGSSRLCRSAFHSRAPQRALWRPLRGTTPSGAVDQ